MTRNPVKPAEAIDGLRVLATMPTRYAPVPFGQRWRCCECAADVAGLAVLVNGETFCSERCAAADPAEAKGGAL